MYKGDDNDGDDNNKQSFFLASGVVMLDTPCSEVVWRLLATHCIRQFPLHFSSHASPCAITFQLDSTLYLASFCLVLILYYIILYYIILYYGTTVVYAVRSWPKLRYATPDCSRLRFKCDGTRAETRFRPSAKGTSPFKWAGGCQFSRLLAAEVCASAVVMLNTPCSEVEWRVLATHSIRQFPLHFPTCASPCANTFQLDSIK